MCLSKKKKKKKNDAIEPKSHASRFSLTKRERSGASQIRMDTVDEKRLLGFTGLDKPNINCYEKDR